MALPQGWMQIRAQDELLVATRNGLGLERIRIHRIPVGTELPNVNRKISRDMLPEDLASLSADSMRLTEGVTNFEVLVSEPAELSGHACYRMEYTLRVASKLEYRGAEYGCLIESHLYSIEFGAPAQHYYAAYIDDFERSSASIEFIAGS
jgi:hypothetical protein